MAEYGRGPGLWHCQVYDIVCTLPLCIRELNEHNRAQTVNYDIISIPFCRKANKEQQQIERLLSNQHKNLIDFSTFNHTDTGRIMSRLQHRTCCPSNVPNVTPSANVHGHSCNATYSLTTPHPHPHLPTSTFSMYRSLQYIIITSHTVVLRP